MSEETPVTAESGWEPDSAVTAVRQHVQSCLLRDIEIGLDPRGRVTIDGASTRVFIEFVPRPDTKQVFVTLTCPIAFHVPMTPSLFEYLARNSDRWYFGHLAMNPYADGGEHAGHTHVFMSHTVVGDYLHPDEIAVPAFAMLNAADSITEDFVREFGGVLYHDS